MDKHFELVGQTETMVIKRRLIEKSAIEELIKCHQSESKYPKPDPSRLHSVLFQADNNIHFDDFGR